MGTLGTVTTELSLIDAFVKSVGDDNLLAGLKTNDWVR